MSIEPRDWVDWLKPDAALELTEGNCVYKGNPGCFCQSPRLDGYVALGLVRRADGGATLSRLGHKVVEAIHAAPTTAHTKED